MIDIDYWNSLSDKDKDYLRKFNSEFYYGYFNTGKYARKKPNINKTSAQKKKIRKRVKIQNQDIWIRGTKSGDKK